MENKKAFHQEVAERIIEELKKGTAPWQKPWSADGVVSALPFNPTTNNRYKGINTIALMVKGIVKGYDDSRWLTYKQAEKEGYQVRKGEKGTMIQFVKTQDFVNKLDEQGKPILKEDGKELKVLVNLERPIITNAYVFNAAQIDGIPALKIEPPKWNPIERVEGIVNDSKAIVKHIAGDSAHYKPKADRIIMPERSQFDSADKYYATLLHELGHWTGHESRLNRDLMNEFGSEDYAREELRAEIASMILGSELGIGHDPSQHVAYVDSWIKVLEKNPFELHLAAADAEKITNYVMDIEHKIDLKADVTNKSEKKMPWESSEDYEQENKVGRSI